jgi:hypothetical protein
MVSMPDRGEQARRLKMLIDIVIIWKSNEAQRWRTRGNML